MPYDAFLTKAFSGRGRTLAERLPASKRALVQAGLPRDATPASIPTEAYARLYTVLVTPSAPVALAGRRE